MNLERFKQIVESYGAESARWPIDEAESARLFLSSSSNAQRCLNEAEKTDQYLDVIRVEPSTAVLDRITLGIEAGIAAEHKVPIAARVSSSANLLSRFIEWLTPKQPRAIASFLRPTLAACLPLVLGIGIGMNVSLDDESTLSSNEEIQLLALSQSSIEEWSIE
ncbi:MAG: hypothetical protein ACI8Z1_000557 [Candidatus Azotimanducaceae bacterium]|jgi:hypothetical protein